MRDALPVHWTKIRLGEVCVINPRTRPDLSPDADVSFVPMTAVDEQFGTIAFPEARKFREVNRGYTPFQNGDVLFAKITPCMQNGKAAIARDLLNGFGYGSTEFYVLRPNPCVLAEWVFYFIRMPAFRAAAATTFRGGVGQQRVPQAFLDNFLIPLPPLSEQRRIVEILQEAEQVRRLRAQAGAKTAQLIPAVFHELFLRGGHREQIQLSKLADVVSGVALGRKIRGSGRRNVAYLRVANVQAGFLDLTEIKETLASEDEIAAFRLEAGDVLLTEGGDFDKLGRGCLWEGQVDPCIHQNHVFRVRAVRSSLHPVFFAHYLQSAAAKYYFLRCAKRTTNLASINLTQLKSLPVPRVPLAAQERFAALVDVFRDCCGDDSSNLESSLIRSLLASAFAGELTAAWRAAHDAELRAEAAERDRWLADAGVSVARAPVTGREAVRVRAVECPDVSRDQAVILRELGGPIRDEQDTSAWITPESLSKRIKGRLRGNPRAIAANLDVLAARGLVIAASQEQEDPMTGEFEYGTAYRLPRDSGQPAGDEDATPANERIRPAELERLSESIVRERRR